MPQYPVSGWQPDMTDGYTSVRPLYGMWRLFGVKTYMARKKRKRNRESFLWLLMAYGENNRKTGELK